MTTRQAYEHDQRGKRLQDALLKIKEQAETIERLGTLVRAANGRADAAERRARSAEERLILK